MPRLIIFGLTVLTLILGTAAQANSVVNIYSARNEALIKPLLDKFTEKTGIQTHLVTAGAGPLLERLRREGRNSPADLFITVDAGRLHEAKEAGVLQPVESATLDAAVPAPYRDPQGLWFGLSLRARPIMYARGRVQSDELSTYEALADPRWRGRICIRSSSNIYNQSLVASIVAADGETATLDWLKGFVKNFARKPAGGDRDQLRAAAAGECDIAIANTYYLARMHTAEPGSPDHQAAKALEVFWPNQNGRGAHVNVSGAGVTTAAPNRDNAIRLLEFLVTDEAQAWYAEVNNEYPVKPGVPWSETVREMGRFKADELNLSALGSNNSLAVKLMDEAGWQ
ncbi:MAG: Fe(3+) ABC transporter substrate-binding protein [Gammaproteobacteria bacterium]|nr:Fe(3+) ABC transporter substrate-binding protein [Gammaproteobacteria bacterium]MDH3413132.1 Fe(3+) ABC transporter substrate-binding protein [Gammaproteobacteria bacterium]